MGNNYSRPQFKGLLERIGNYILRNVFPTALLITALIYVGLHGLGGSEVLSNSGPHMGSLPWLRWDSFHYLSIAEYGYKAEPCGEFICGNTGWFPLFPWVIRFFFFLGIPLPWSSLLTTFLSILVASELLSRLINRRWTPFAIACAFLVLPGGVYQLAAFPVSLTIALDLLSVWLSLGSFVFLSAASGFMAAFAYPSSVILSVALAPFLLLRTPLVAASYRSLRLLPVVAPFLGFSTARAWIDHSVSIASAYSLTQARYGHSWSLGFNVLRSSIRYLWKNPVFLQTTVVFVLMILSTVVLVQHLLAHGSLLGCVFLIMGWSYWILPHLIGDSVSIYRQEALIAPMFIFAGSLLRRRTIFVLSIPLLSLSLVMTKLFLLGSLV